MIDAELHPIVKRPAVETTIRACEIVSLEDTDAVVS